MLTEDEKLDTFSVWVSGYFSHGDTPDTYERRKSLEHPPPTASTLRPDDLAACVYAPPGDAGGSDFNLMFSALSSGLFSILRTRALRLCGDGENQWRDVELRWVWGGRSFWQTVYGIWMLRAELEEAKERSELLRNIRIVTIEKGSHFVRIRPQFAISGSSWC